MNTRPFPSFWIYRDNRKEWRWTYEASNGLTVAVSSEGYVRKADCMRGIEIVQGSAAKPIWIPNEDMHAV